MQSSSAICTATSSSTDTTLVMRCGNKSSTYSSRFRSKLRFSTSHLDVKLEHTFLSMSALQGETHIKSQPMVTLSSLGDARGLLVSWTLTRA